MGHRSVWSDGLLFKVLSLRRLRSVGSIAKDELRLVDVPSHHVLLRTGSCIQGRHGRLGLGREDCLHTATSREYSGTLLCLSPNALLP